MFLSWWGEQCIPAVLYEYSSCSVLISGPHISFCSFPLVFTRSYPQGPGLSRSSLGTTFHGSLRLWTRGSCWSDVGQVLWSSRVSRDLVSLPEFWYGGVVPGVWSSSWGWMVGSLSTDSGSESTLLLSKLDHCPAQRIQWQLWLVCSGLFPFPPRPPV